jgi:hypothetical protein
MTAGHGDRVEAARALDAALASRGLKVKAKNLMLTSGGVPRGPTHNPRER